ncbi:MAG: cation:proton antiporter [Gordonia sp. (in: high G+C Gram-positive bacteria)]
MEIVAIAVVCVLAVTAANALAPRVRVAAPLLLVGVGVVVSFLPRMPEISVDPEILLVAVLPPLLYAAARAMPVMDFQRDFQSIGALSIALVVLSSLVLGAFFSVVLPDVDFALGVALGAILSPTNAVATGTIKRLGAPNRIVTVLSGESLFNDATSLVLLRAAIAATAGGISFGGVVVNFAWSMVAAVAVGALVGALLGRLQARIHVPALSTAVSFTAPYIAFVPAELIGASGLVGAVAAGLVSGRVAVHKLSAAQRASDLQNWHMVESLLEGGVFLLMGLELATLVIDVREENDTWLHALWPAALALVLSLTIRAAFMIPLVWWLDRRARRLLTREEPLEAMKDALDDGRSPATAAQHAIESSPAARRRFRRSPKATSRRFNPSTDTAVRRFRVEIDRRLADIAYYQTEAMGPREGMAVVWGGLRGVVTLAAAQTLPEDTPHRSLLILIAFFVAALSLGLQGGLMGPVLEFLRLPDQSEQVRAEKQRLRGEMFDVAGRVLTDPAITGIDPAIAERVRTVRELESPDVDDSDTEDVLDMRLQKARELRRVRRIVIAEQRKKLLALRERRAYSSNALTAELAKLDAEEISLSL